MGFLRRDPEPEPEPDEVAEPEVLSRVQVYRLRRFEALGFDAIDARALAKSDADVHRVERMLGGGCGHHTALLIEL